MCAPGHPVQMRISSWCLVLHGGAPSWQAQIHLWPYQADPLGWDPALSSGQLVAAGAPLMLRALSTNSEVHSPWSVKLLKGSDAERKVESTNFLFLD